MMSRQSTLQGSIRVLIRIRRPRFCEHIPVCLTRESLHPSYACVSRIIWDRHHCSEIVIQSSVEQHPVNMATTTTCMAFWLWVCRLWNNNSNNAMSGLCDGLPGILPSHRHALHSGAAGACTGGDMQERMHAGAQCRAYSGTSCRPCWTAHLSEAEN